MSNLRDVQRSKRDKLFLKGPIYFGWIRQNIADPTARLLLVARAFMDMEEKTHYPLTSKVWNSAGINDRSKRTRVLKNIVKNVKDYSVERRVGRTSVIYQNNKPN